MCVEVHDHHCPYVGNCIGYRNLKVFNAFLFWTATLALVTVFMVMAILTVQGDSMDTTFRLIYSVTAKLLIGYGATIAFLLYLFWFYQVCSLGLNNVTSNEDIRHRWNGHYRNKKAVKLFKKEAGCCGRLKYLLCSNIEDFHGRSKLQNYAEYVETYFKAK